MSYEKGEAFNEMREIYYDAAEEAKRDFDDALEAINGGIAGNSEAEREIAAENFRITSSVVSSAVRFVGKYIEDTAEAYEKYDDYKGEDNFCKGDHLYISGAKSYHAIYIGGGKAVHYSKGYDFFPEVKLVPLGYFAKKGKVEADRSAKVKFPPEIVARRAMSKLGDNDFKNSEDFVRWCMGV